MNKMYKIAAALIAGFGLTLVSCDDAVMRDDEPEVSLDAFTYVKGSEIVRYDVEPSFFTDFLNGEVSGSFKQVSYASFYRGSRTDGRWELPDVAFAPSRSWNDTPKNMYISEGCVWEPSETVFTYYFYSANPFNTALAQINEKLGTNYKVFVNRPVEFDSETSKLKVGKLEFDVLAAKDGKLTLAEKEILYGGGEDLDIYCYEWIDETINMLSEDLMKFNSSTEAYDWLIDLYTKNFTITDDYKKYADPNNAYYMMDNPDCLYVFLLEEQAIHIRRAAQ